MPSDPMPRRTLIGAGFALAAGLGARPVAAQALSRFAGRAAAFDALLARRARLSPDGVVRVDYAGWRGSAADRDALRRYLDGLTALDPLTLTRPEQFAYWANLYNALTIRVVLDAWPVASIRNIRTSGLLPGPWWKAITRVAGADLSLNNIEHDILRKGWREPRVHYAVNCASFSCPNLPLRALRGAGLDETLDAAARSYVNHPRGVRFEGERLIVSSIYRWYGGDFGGSDARVIAHLAQYATPTLRARLQAVDRIARGAYDWSINATSEA
jgi:hypothetical protein